jgi:hypothetical protein
MAALTPTEMTTRIADDVEARLKAHVATVAIFGSRVYQTGDTLPGDAPPYAVIRKGTNHTGSNPSQQDFSIDTFASNNEIMPTALIAVQSAISGWFQETAAGPIKNGCTLTDTGRQQSIDGKIARRDTFAAFYDPLWEAP